MTAHKPALFVLTSHGTKGDSGQPTGFYFGEVTHPLAELEAGGIPVEFASILDGEPPVDSLDPNDATNARYWNEAGFRATVDDAPDLLSDFENRLTRKGEVHRAYQREPQTFDQNV